MFFKQRFLALHKWQRACFMLFFVFIKATLSVVISCIALFQFLHVLFTNLPNVRILAITQLINRYLYQVVAFLGYVDEEPPFPFNELGD